MQRLAVLSLVFHITFFVAVFLAVKQSTHFVVPSSYIVNLVGSEIKTEEDSTQVANRSPEPPVSEAVSKKEKSTVPTPKESKKLSRSEEQQLRERIDALKAKRKAIEIAKLRNKLKNIIPLKRSGIEGKTGTSPRVTGKGEGSMIADYYTRITKEIWDKWELPPEMKEKNLEAIVSIRISKDGFVQVMRIEKTSGNPLFDRSVFRAINKASPLTPPPYEMEIGVRFYP